MSAQRHASGPRFRFGRRLFRFATVFGLGAAALGLAACHRGSSPEARLDWAASRIASAFDFNDEQRTKLDGVKAELRTALTELHGERDKARLVLREEIAKDRLDAPRISASLQGALDVVSRTLPRVVQSIADLHASLSPEQKREVQDKVTSHLDRWGTKGP